MLELKPEPGMAVSSRQGRDKGKLYAVISLQDQDFAFVSDGETRPLKKQKRKRVKHLKLSGTVFEGIAAKLSGSDKKKLYDTEIKRALKLYKEGQSRPQETKKEERGKDN